jgi:hypothetical protein
MSFKSEMKNPIFWLFIVCFCGGIALAITGWLRYEAIEVKKFTVPQMIIGGVMIVAGAVGFFTVGNRKS